MLVDTGLLHLVGRHANSLSEQLARVYHIAEKGCMDHEARTLSDDSAYAMCANYTKT